MEKQADNKKEDRGNVVDLKSRKGGAEQNSAPIVISPPPAVLYPK